jgi:hypothetical protein
LRDRDWRVRLAACQRAPVALLAPLLEDDDEDVRAAVRERLGKRQA